MALIDVVKWEVNSKEIVHKFPSEDLRIGTQLVVYAGQTAFFVKGGKILDCFEAGTYTIKTENIPLLNKLINIPFGGNSPFQAEVWFVNTLAILDTKWGTPAPLQLEDPVYGVIVPVRAFGQYGIKVDSPRLFLDSLVGNAASFSVNKIDSYFKGKMLSMFSNLLSDKMVKDSISVLAINSHLSEMSTYVQNEVDKEFKKYGLTLETFNVMSANVPEDDPSFIKLKEAKDLAARIKIAGKDIYQMERSFNVMDKAAANEGGATGNIMNMGVGLAAGMNMGNQMGAMASQAFNTQSVPPPLPQAASYYLVINGQQLGPYDTNAIASYIQGGQISRDTFVWKQGMPAWSPIGSLPEFANMFGVCPPPIPMP